MRQVNFTIKHHGLRSFLIVLISFISVPFFSQVKSIKIGTQVWTKTNLDVSTYQNGDAIPQVQNAAEWQKLSTGAWCYYENKTANGITYGKLYNWYAVTDSRGLAPKGWHIPAWREWKEMTEFLGGAKVAGGKIKTKDKWIKPYYAFSNSSGFSAIPAGVRSSDGKFSSLGSYSTWWCTEPDQDSKDNAWEWSVDSNTLSIDRVPDAKTQGCSVRCIKD